nr:hypothetical protein CFP56_50960 [Quercus suber]
MPSCFCLVAHLSCFPAGVTIQASNLVRRNGRPHCLSPQLTAVQKASFARNIKSLHIASIASRLLALLSVLPRWNGIYTQLIADEAACAAEREIG